MSHPLVRLSVIVPAYNCAAFLDRSLTALARSSFRDYECIVVDDASTDHSRDVAAKHGVRLLALGSNGGPARARNRAAEQARGEILVFIDADVCVHPDTLGRIDAHFRAHPQVEALMGSYDDTPAHRGFVSQYKNLFHHYVHQTSRSQAWTFWAGCGAIRRPLFLQFHGFDESYRRPCIEDIELGFRLAASGHRIDLEPAVQVTHLKRWTLWNLLRTDVRDRGIPWFLLMLRDRTMPADLNVTRTHRLSVLLVFALVAVAGVALAEPWLPRWLPATLPLRPIAAGALAALAAALFSLNYDFYRFFLRKRGLLFTAGVLPLHWLYYLYCGVAVGAALTLHLWDRVTARRLRWQLSVPPAAR
ncbi:MAG: glycosyltransferase family 2 protein [Deltaproteobacteria bacterium]|nr:glycosyltransferase family 2 protein [Deltaproteobacteria bacterium]